jgi:hypothetical protein
MGAAAPLCQPPPEHGPPPGWIVLHDRPPEAWKTINETILVNSSRMTVIYRNLRALTSA